jgi:hypothetical protein
MRIRSGKGLVVAFDAILEKKLEELRKGGGFYPTLKTIGESYNPPHSVSFIDRALRRLSEAGRLSDEACQVYNAKTKEKQKNENKSITTKKVSIKKTNAKAQR